jgi:UDP-glucose 4-epimerase
LGFIGSNLAIRLVKLGAKVTIVDNMLPRQGGNLFNIKEIESQVNVQFSDITSALSMNNIVKDKALIFHLAGQVNHIDSMRNPINDLDINCKGTLVILEACRNFNGDAKIIFTGTRGQYGPTVKLPVDENHPMDPKGIYAITNMAAEKMVMVYNNVHGIRGVCLRISNTYGPRHQMRHDEYGVFNWFIRKAIDNETIPVFGNGRIVRDFIYIDDVVDGLLMVGINEASDGEVFNMGSGQPVDFISLAKKIAAIAANGKYEFSEFTRERKELEHGDYCSDCSKIKRLIGWEPKIDIDEGIANTIKFYRKFKKYYW